MPRIAPLLIAAALLLGAAAPPRAQVADSFATLPYLAETDPDAALDEILQLTAWRDPDPRAIYDLYRMAASLLIEGGQVEAAAQAIAKLAALAARNRDNLGLDPLPVYAEAAALLRDTGQTAAARDTLVSMYEEQRISGAGPEVLTRTARDIADLTRALGEVPPALSKPIGSENFRSMPVPYATDRAPSGEATAPLYYSAAGGPLAFGVATVSLPVRPGTADYSKLRDLLTGSQAAWLADLDATGKRGVLLYVHGAATPFEQAARRVAQIARSLGGVEVPVLYSWPASASTLDYMADSAATRRSARHLARVLEALAARPGQPRPHLLARGMGAQVLTDALELIAARRSPGAPPPFGQLILAGPDMDADLLRDLLPVLRPMVQRITLYVSEMDAQMALPRRLYGPALRAGWGGEATLSAAGADSIDLSPLETDMLAAPAVLSDIAMLLWKDAAPARRCGLGPDAGSASDPPVWRLEEGICSDPALTALLARLRRDNVQTRDQAQAVLGAAVTDPAVRERLLPVLSRLLPR